jgi:hypothetical protein
MKTRNKDSSGKLYPWSITTEIALHLNDYDLTLALENGQQLPHPHKIGENTTRRSNSEIKSMGVSK